MRFPDYSSLLLCCWRYVAYAWPVAGAGCVAYAWPVAVALLPVRGPLLTLRCSRGVCCLRVVFFPCVVIRAFCFRFVLLQYNSPIMNEL